MRLFYRLLLADTQDSSASKPWDEVMAQCPECRWITLKPHGDDHPHYVHVLIRPSGSGMRVVWAGDKALTHLRLSPGERKQGATPKIVDPKARAEYRKKREQQYEQHLGEYYAAAAKLLGLRPEDLKGVNPLRLTALVKGHAGEVKRQAEKTAAAESPAPESPAPESEHEPKPESEEEKLAKQIEAAYARAARAERHQGVTALGALAVKAFESELSVLSGSTVRIDDQVPQALRDALSQLDEARARDLLQLVSTHEQERKRYRQDIRQAVEEREDYYARAESVDAEDVLTQLWGKLASDAAERDLAKRNIGLWQAYDAYGRGVTRHYLSGAQESALSIMSDTLGVRSVPSELVGLLGVEGAAQFVLKQIRQHLGDTGMRETVQNLETMYRERVVKAAQDSERILAAERATREQIDQLAQGADAIYDARLRKRELARELALRRRQIGQLTGSLSFYAALLDHARRGNAEKPVRVSASGEIDEIRNHAARHGLREGEHYILVEERGGRLRMELTADGESHLASRLTTRDALGRTVESLRAGQTTLPPDWRPQGMITHLPSGAEVRLTDEQRGAIEFAMTQRRAVWHLAAGIGKSLASLALGKQLQDDGKVDKVIYLVPSRLRENMLAEARQFFGNAMRVGFAGTISATAKRQHAPDSVGQNASERARVIGDSNVDVVIVGFDTLADGDADAIRKEIERLGGRVLVVVDEAHEAFSPGAGQSERMKAMETIQSAFTADTHVVAMTGTPVRQRVSDLAAITSWATNDKSLSRERFLYHHQGVETGANVMQELVDGALERAIAPHVYRRGYQLKGTTLETHEIVVEPSDDQKALFRDLNEQFQRAKEQGQPPPPITHEHYRALFAPKQGQNPLLSRLQQIVQQEEQEWRQKGIRTCGLVFVNYTDEVEAVKSAFREGEVIAYVGSMNAEERAQARNAINEGTIVAGGRAAITYQGKRVEGVVTEYDPKSRKGTIRLEGGGMLDFDDSHSPESLVKLMVATSAGSTGLNLQKGAGYVVHYTPAWTASEMEQRTARAYRRGQTRDTVRNYVLKMNVPHAEWIYRKHELQARAAEAEPEWLETLQRASLDENGKLLELMLNRPRTVQNTERRTLAHRLLLADSHTLAMRN